jgi:hypothetical protein
VGRPSHKPVFRFKTFIYQAASWTIARRVVAKVEFHCGELFPRVGFIVTNLGTSSQAVVRGWTCVWRIADLCRKSVIRHTQVSAASVDLETRWTGVGRSWLRACAALSCSAATDFSTILILGEG